MSKIFKFKDNSLKLNIEGHEFVIDVDEYVGNVEKVEYFTNLAAKVQGLTGKDKYEIEKVIKVCNEAVNEILGEGAMDKIFEKKKITPLRLIELISFLSDEINEFRIDNVMNKYRVTASAVKDESVN